MRNRFFASFGTDTLLSNSLWVFAERSVRMAIGLGVNMTLARSLGPEYFGVITYATAQAALFLPFVSLGLERIVVRELAAGGNPAETLIGSAVVVRFLGGVVSVALAVLSACFNTTNDDTKLLVAVIAAANLFLVFDVIDWWFQAHERFRPIAVARGVIFLLGSGAKIGFVLVGAPLIWIGGTILGESILAAMLLLGLYVRRGMHIAKWRFDSAIAREILVQGAPLLVAEIGVWIFQKIDIVLLQNLTGPGAVGIYGLAQRIAQTVFFMPVLAVQLLSPAIARCNSNGAALVFTGRTMTVLAMIGLGWSFFLTFAAKPLVLRLFGTEYHDAIPLLIWLAWATIFVFIGCAHSLYLINRRHQSISMRLTWVTATVNIVLNLVLIPTRGAQGAAWAAFFSYGCTTVFGVLLFSASRPLFMLNIKALLAPVLWPCTRLGLLSSKRD